MVRGLRVTSCPRFDRGACRFLPVLQSAERGFRVQVCAPRLTSLCPKSPHVAVAPRAAGGPKRADAQTGALTVFNLKRSRHSKSRHLSQRPPHVSTALHPPARNSIDALRGSEEALVQAPVTRARGRRQSLQCIRPHNAQTSVQTWHGPRSSVEHSRGGSRQAQRPLARGALLPRRLPAPRKRDRFVERRIRAQDICRMGTQAGSGASSIFLDRRHRLARLLSVDARRAGATVGHLRRAAFLNQCCNRLDSFAASARTTCRAVPAPPSLAAASALFGLRRDDDPPPVGVADCGADHGAQPRRVTPLPSTTRYNSGPVGVPARGHAPETAAGSCGHFPNRDMPMRPTKFLRSDATAEMTCPPAKSTRFAAAPPCPIVD